MNAYISTRETPKTGTFHPNSTPKCASMLPKCSLAPAQCAVKAGLAHPKTRFSYNVKPQNKALFHAPPLGKSQQPFPNRRLITRPPATSELPKKGKQTRMSMKSKTTATIKPQTQAPQASISEDLRR